MLTRLVQAPIQRQVLLLALVLIATPVILFSVHLLLDHKASILRESLGNQTARREIGVVIDQRLAKMGMLLYRMRNLRDIRDFAVSEQQFDLAQATIRSALEVLQHGGVLEYRLDVNVGQQEQMFRRVSYRKPTNRYYVIEALELAPQMLLLEKQASLLQQLISSRIKAGDARPELEKQIDEAMKVISTTLQRAQENTHDVMMETAGTAQKLEQKLSETNSLFNLLRSIVIMLGIFIAAYLLYFSLRRIGVIDQKQKLAEENVRLLLDATAEGIYGLDEKGLTSFVNPAASRMLGFTPEELLGRENHSLIHHTKEDGSPYPLEECPLHAACLDGNQRHVDNELLWRKDGSSFHVEYVSTPIIRDGRNVGTVVNFSDITERIRAEKLIQRQAHYDFLTGLPNRRMLLERLEQVLASCRRHGHHGALLFIDLDNFKTINDSLGHPVGDQLLQQVATRLTSALRKEDLVARLGGDEFVVLISEINDNGDKSARAAWQMADKLAQVLTLPYSVQDNELHVTPSIGVALFPDDQQTADDVLKNADIAMYQAKDDGRNLIRFFLPSMQQAAEKRLQLQNELRSCLQQDQLRLYIQPQLNRQHEVVGGEVLLRWQHPERGLVYPDEFIEVAEESGQILGIGEWVLRSACQLLADWVANDVQRPALQLAVNVSPVQLRQVDFAERMEAVLRISDVDPAQITLEMTEGVLLHNLEDTVRKMNHLKALGVRFSIDDFGTGYSSLAYLKRLPVDEVKIDRSFVSDLTNDTDDASLVETILTMAQNLKLDVVAEGVEAEDELDFLMSRGCDLFQGYYFKKPCPVEEFEVYLCDNASSQLVS